MMGARRWWRQVVAVTIAECQRLLTSPAWAVLLALWTAVCALFAQVVVAHAAHNELPAGETPMGAFFRFFPGLLPLLLVVFIPQLAMDAIAGRRERGRLEHLQLAGMAPGALVVGAFLALCVIGVVLVVPLFIFHMVLGSSDLGSTLAATLVVLLQASALAALALAIGAWMPGRLSAALCAGAAGLAWWIADVFAPAVSGTEALAGSWHQALGLSQAIHDAAGGTIAIRQVLAMVILDISLLALTRCALRWRHQISVAAVTAGALIALTLGLISHVARIDRSVDWAATPPLQTTTRSAIETLTADGPLRATLVCNAAMTNDPVDGPVVSQARRILRAATDAGLQWTVLDPERSPRSVAALRDQHRVSDKDLSHPFILIEHLDRSRVLPLREMAVVEEIDGQRHLMSVFVEPSFAGVCQRLHGALPQVAWMTTTQTRPPAATGPHQRRSAVATWRRAVAAQGCAVTEVDKWQDLATSDAALVIIPGLQADPPAAGISALQTFIDQGGHVLLAVDGTADANLAHVGQFLAPFGLGWTGSRLVPDQGRDVMDARPVASDGPAANLLRQGSGVILPDAQALNADQGRRGLGSIGTWLPVPAGTIVRTPVGDGVLDGPHPSLLTSESAHAGDTRGRVALFASVQAFADGHIDRGGNRDLATSLVQWLLRDADHVPAAHDVAASRRHTLSPTRQALARWGAGLVIPLLALGCGAGVWWWRRRP